MQNPAKENLLQAFSHHQPGSDKRRVRENHIRHCVPGRCLISRIRLAGLGIRLEDGHR
jgi:hypothetical protein